MTQTVQNALKRRATAWAGQLTRLAKGFAPNHIRDAISSHVEEKGEGSFAIRITASRALAPDARAQEYGSGLRARRGPKQKYPIRPKTKKVLAFYWEVADLNPEYFDFLPDGRVMLRAVQHPGIQAANGGRGYIAPAVTELKKKARKELTEDVRLAIMSDIRRSFGRAKR